jgi:hypothetical protein
MIQWHQQQDQELRLMRFLHGTYLMYNQELTYLISAIIDQ